VRFIFAEFQEITGQPVANPFKAADEAFSCFLVRDGWYADVQLCVISIRVTGKTKLSHNIKQVRHVQEEQN